MKAYEEMAQNALDRISNYEAEKKEWRKTVAKIAAPAVSLCLAAILCVSAWQSGWFKTKAPLVATDNTDSEGSYHSIDNNIDAVKSNIVDDKKSNAQIITGDSTGQKGADSDSANEFCYFWWNHLNVNGPLYFAIKDNPGSTFAILATYRPTTANIPSFFYEGKTLAEWATKAFEENASQDTKKGYKLAYNAYLETVFPSVISRLTENGIQCERADYMNNGLIFLVTAEKLKSLPLEDLGSWYFDLASDNFKGASNTETDATGFPVVN